MKKVMLLVAILAMFSISCRNNENTNSTEDQETVIDSTEVETDFSELEFEVEEVE